MKAKSLASITLLAGAMALSAPVFAATPTVHEVYLAAEAGKFDEAQAMMDQVLKANPNSAKAHFVEAELLAKQGKFAAAQKSLDTAERLSPGLPKVDPAAVSKLRTVLAEGEAKPKTNYSQQQPTAGKTGYNGGGYANGAGAAGGSGGGIPWGTILLMGGLLVGFIFIASRFMSRRAQQGAGGGFNQGNQGFNPGGTPPGYPPGGGYPQQGGPGYGQQPQGNGMGSRIMGGLATGAALGAGLVAGEAIARQFTGGHENGGNAANDQGRNDIVYDDPTRSNIVQGDDMGGTDFGVSGGWDDAGGGGGGDAGGGDDWN